MRRALFLMARVALLMLIVARETAFYVAADLEWIADVLTFELDGKIGVAPRRNRRTARGARRRECP